MREFSAVEREVFLAGTKAFRKGGDAHRAAIQKSALRTDEEISEEERCELLESSCNWLWEPMRRDEPFDFGQED